jgi:hypothetical protein
MSQFNPPSYQQGLAAQIPMPPQQVQGQQQTVKFYKSAIFLFASAAGRLERDLPRMESQGWRLQYAMPLGINIFLRRIVIAIYTH